MDGTLILALGTAIIVSFLSPVVLSWIQGRQRRAEKAQDAAIAAKAAKADEERKRRERQEDNDRQDQIAARVEGAATLAATAATNLAEAQAATIAAAELVAKKAAETDAAVTEKLEQIHGLVNSDMTAARHAERDAVRNAAAKARLNMSLMKRLAMPIPPEDVAALELLDARVEDLNNILADRLAAQTKIDDDTEEKKKKKKNQFD